MHRHTTCVSTYVRALIQRVLIGGASERVINGARGRARNSRDRRTQLWAQDGAQAMHRVLRRCAREGTEVERVSARYTADTPASAGSLPRGKNTK